MGMIYEKCPQCNAGQAEPPMRRRDGQCMACAGRLYVPIGLDTKQLERLMIALKHYVRKDMGRNSAFATGHYYLHYRGHTFKGDDSEVLIEQVVNALAAGEAQ